MAIEFSRSLHSLKADRYIIPVVLIGFVIVLVLVWLGWLLFGSIPDYKEGTDPRYEDGIVYAQFPYETRQILRAGQPAIVNVAGDGNGTPVEVEGVVYEVSYNQDNNEVSVFMTENNPALPALMNERKASVRVLVESYSPLQFMLNRSNSAPNMALGG